MSDLTHIERMKFEKLFEMGSGYVLNFSNRTMEEFVANSVGLNIYDEKYAYSSGSKANRLRAVFKIEANHVVGKLLSDLLDYMTAMWDPKANSTELFKDCRKISERLQSNPGILHLPQEPPIDDDAAFEKLAQNVRKSIESDDPLSALDRLHTFTTRYLRYLCNKHSISAPKEKPLHSLFGEYVKSLQKQGVIETDMTARILKSAISIMDSYNAVRNDKTLAHDNVTLNYEESMLIYNWVTSMIRYIQHTEAVSSQVSKKLECDDDDLPF